MSDERLREILSVEPGADEVAFRSRRARRRALEAYETIKPQRRWRAALAAGFAIVFAGTLLLRGPAAVAPQASSPSQAGRRVEMRLQLSDGTRVNWVMDDRYAL